MRFAAFVPPQADRRPVPVLWYLSGLTCTERKLHRQGGCTADRGRTRAPADRARYKSARGCSTRRFGGLIRLRAGAGFMSMQRNSRGRQNYRMASYVERELPGLISSELPADVARQSIMGHSMGGHGALTIALRNQDRYASVSAFSPICSPMNCQWGQKALSGYLGSNKENWRRYDTCALLEDGARVTELLVDQGTADQFLETQLKPELLERCMRSGQCSTNACACTKATTTPTFSFPRLSRNISAGTRSGWASQPLDERME